MEDFKNITLLELDNFLGNICLYSLNFEKSLGDNVNLKYSKLFQNNMVTYNNSLSNECQDDLIIIDGDDFNPSKIFGLTKKYTNPIVIFVSIQDKIEKLKSLLLRNVLIINKNTLNSLDFSKNIEKNLEIKKQRDLEKEMLLKEKEEGLDELKSFNDKIEKDKDKENNFNYKEEGNYSESTNHSKENELDKDMDDFVERKIKEEKFLRKLKAEEKKKFEEIEEFEKYSKKENEFIEKDKDFTSNIQNNDNDNVTAISKKDKILQRFFERFNNSFPIENFGIFGLNIEVSNRFRDIFPNIYTIKTSEEKEYDVYVLDISFATDRIYNLIERIMPKPLIIMSSFEEKLADLKYLKLNNVLIIPKPLTYTQEELEDRLFEYLNNYSKKNEENKKNKFKDFFVPIGGELKDDSIKKDIRNKYEFKNESKTIDETKEEINKSNKRSDKDISLSDIYEKLGLNKLAIFESLVNKEVYSTYDGKVIKYNPNGILIEIRLERLKTKGLSEKEINDAMKRLEEADIRFERKQLMRMERYKLNQLKQN